MQSVLASTLRPGSIASAINIRQSWKKSLPDFFIPTIRDPDTVHTDRQRATTTDGHFNIDGLMDVMTRSYKSLEEEKEAILSAFRVFDKQNTGKIDADELRHIFVTLGDALTQEEVTESLKLANIDKDGKIDYNEFALVLLPQPLPRR